MAWQMKPRIKMARFRLFGRGRWHRYPTPDNGKFKWADVVTAVATILFVSPDVVDKLFEKIPYGEQIRDYMLLVAAACMLYGIYLYFHDLCPRSRWGRASWSVGLISLTWSVLPFILYYVGEDNSWEDMCRASMWSASMWAVWLFCIYKYWRVRVRSKQEIARMELRERRQRRTYM